MFGMDLCHLLDWHSKRPFVPSISYCCRKLFREASGVVDEHRMSILMSSHYCTDIDGHRIASSRDGTYKFGRFFRCDLVSSDPKVSHSLDPDDKICCKLCLPCGSIGRLMDRPVSVKFGRFLCRILSMGDRRCCQQQNQLLGTILGRTWKLSLVLSNGSKHCLFGCALLRVKCSFLICWCNVKDSLLPLFVSWTNMSLEWLATVYLN